MFSKSIPNENKADLTPIDSYLKAKFFWDRLVAFKTTSRYFGIGQGYTLENSEIRYAFISASFVEWNNGEHGHNMTILLKPKDIASNNALIDSKLKDANMQMRLVTKEEIDIIEKAIIDGKAKFEFMSDKNKMIDLLNIERSKLSNNAGNKLSR